MSLLWPPCGHQGRIRVTRGTTAIVQLREGSGVIRVVAGEVVRFWI
jgi:hypothetical protein